MSEQNNAEEEVVVEEAAIDETAIEEVDGAELDEQDDTAASTQILNHGVLSPESLKATLEAAIFASGESMSVKRMAALFDEAYMPSTEEIRAALASLAEDYEGRGVELSHVASGYRFQAKAEYAPYLQKLWEKKPPRFSRAMLETLALIAYRQPITRGEIEEVRGVSTSSHIMKVLQEREWVKIVAYKDVPGKPALFGTTKDFLDYFNLKHLKDMPDLKEIIDLDQKEKDLNEQLVLNMSLQEQANPDAEQAVISTEEMADDTEELVIPAPEPGSSEEAVEAGSRIECGMTEEETADDATVEEIAAEELSESIEDADVKNVIPAEELVIPAPEPGSSEEAVEAGSRIECGMTGEEADENDEVSDPEEIEAV
ncbi:MAG: SMC-Scp complex subunit ScpB [Coxiellaceae bacterium]|nr:SMC-Scp complex subunit ScpB [Coxiellaceae bacterium]